jgi:hypothetical protein
MTDGQAESWKKSVFDIGEQIAVKPHYDSISVVNDNAAAAKLTLAITFVYKANKQIGNNTASQRVSLSRQSDGSWLITEVK